MQNTRLFYVHMMPRASDTCYLYSTDQEELDYWLEFFTEKLDLDKKKNSVRRDSYAISFYFRGWKFLNLLDLKEPDDSIWWIYDQLIQRGWEPFRWGESQGYFIKHE